MRVAPPARHPLLAAFCLFAALAASSAHAAGPIASGQVLPGSVASPSYAETWTFTGSTGQRVLIGAVTTSGAMNTNIVLRNPSGTIVWNSSVDRAEYQLTASGTWTIVIEDFGLNDPGSYSLSLMNITAGPHTTGSDPDGGAIVSSEVKTGTTGTTPDFDAFTFSGVAGQRVLIGCVATTVVPYNTTFYLYPPGGGTFETWTTGDVLDWKLLATGTYTIVVEDQGLDHTGSYSLSLLNVTAGPFTSGSDPDGGAVVSSEVKSGSISTTPDWDAYTFSGVTGQRVVIGNVVTGGAMDTYTYLFPPNGDPAVLASSLDRQEYQLTVSGTWTIVVADFGLDQTGSYSLSLMNITAGPHTTGSDPDGGAIVSNQRKIGTTGTTPDFDAYTFQAKAGERVLIACIATTAAPYNTTFYVYPPGGGPFVTWTTGDRIDAQLLSAGTYTIVVEDQGLDHAGGYAMTLVNLGSGPLTDPGDLNGGLIVSGANISGSISPAPDIDAYWFDGAAGDTARVTATATSGTLNTFISIYPQAGGAAVVATSVDAVTYVLTQSGRHSIVIEDFANDDTGNYNLVFTKTVTTLDAPGDRGGPLDPARVLLLPAAPMPFVSTTMLTFSLPDARNVALDVYDVTGARVRTVTAGRLAPGVHRFAWDGRDDRGGKLAAGVYYARLVAGKEVLSQRLAYVR